MFQRGGRASRRKRFDQFIIFPNSLFNIISCSEQPWTDRITSFSSSRPLHSLHPGTVSYWFESPSDLFSRVHPSAILCPDVIHFHWSPIILLFIIKSPLVYLKFVRSSPDVVPFPIDWSLPSLNRVFSLLLSTCSPFCLLASLRPSDWLWSLIYLPISLPATAFLVR